jgi:hypothetical protein
MMMNKQNSAVLKVGARRMFGVDENVRTDGKILLVHNSYATEKMI